MQIANKRNRTLLDAMVLLAAIAAGFGLVNAIGMQFNLSSDEPGSLLRKLFLQLPHFLTYIIVPILVTSAVGVLILGRLPPSYAWRLWVRQPGVSGPLAVLMVVAIDGLWYVAIHFANPRRHPHVFHSALGRWANLGSVALIASWLTLWLTGRWRRPRPWPDRLGSWIAIMWLGCWSIMMITSIVASAIT